MSLPRVRDLRMRHLLVLLVGLLSLAALAASASVIMLRVRPAVERGRPVQPDSIAMTARLDRYEYRLEDVRTALITATGTGVGRADRSGRTR